MVVYKACTKVHNSSLSASHRVKQLNLDRFSCKTSHQPSWNAGLRAFSTQEVQQRSPFPPKALGYTTFRKFLSVGVRNSGKRSVTVKTTPLVWRIHTGPIPANTGCVLQSYVRNCCIYHDNTATIHLSCCPGQRDGPSSLYLCNVNSVWSLITAALTARL